jgi:hypothetical protein
MRCSCVMFPTRRARHARGTLHPPGSTGVLGHHEPRRHDVAARPAWAIAVKVSGVSYYWGTYPAFVSECLSRLRVILEDASER